MKQTACCLLALLVCTLAATAQSYVPEKFAPLMEVKATVPVKAYAFPLADVSLLNSPFRHAFEMDSAYLKSIEPNRLLYRFYQHAGLPVKDSIYAGWESEGLSGHTLGHYLSAVSLLYTVTRDPDCKKRIDYIVSELARCQNARGTGYVGAIPGEDSIFAQVARGEIRSSGFDLNGGWSPWYTVHKVMAGLADAYLYTDNKQALQVLERMAEWTQRIIGHLSDPLRLKMLNCEYGGMNDVLANLYAFTGNRNWLELSYKFYDEFVMGQLAKQIDPLPGKHSNTNVPKAIGSARQYELSGNPRDSTIAAFFWDVMVNHHSYVIGGNSNYEYCGRPDTLYDQLSDNTCETCNTYNMLKLTRHLFAWQPSARLMDFYERALYNHILASQNPDDGMMTYFVPLRMGTQKEFSTPFTTFTCCVGSGMENHTKYAEQIYSWNGKDALYVNLYIPSVLQWKNKQVVIRQEHQFPKSDQLHFTITTNKQVAFTLRLRKPFWVQPGAICKINGKLVSLKEGDDGYWEITRSWKNADELTLTLPMNVYTEAIPGDTDRIAIKYGPLVLAGLLGKEQPDPVIGTPVLMTANRDPQKWIIRQSEDDLTFAMQQVGQPENVSLKPFYAVHDQYYSVYWDYFTPQEWANRQQDYLEEKKRQQQIAEQTIDHFRVGEMQPERDHQLSASERSYVSDALGRKGREARAGHYFSFVMKVDSSAENTLLLTYIGDDKNRVFDILVDGILLKKITWNGGETGQFYDESYVLPAGLTNGKTQISIRVEANDGKTAGRVFSVRTLRKPLKQ